MPNTRLLVLGCVRFSQPVHGYEVRRELLSWSVESWARVNPGSIYHALGQLTREGQLEVVGTEQQTGRPARTLYRLTRFGDEEFFRLLRDQAWTTGPPHDDFSTVLSFIWALSAEEAMRILRHHISAARLYADQLMSSADEFSVSTVAADGRPWVVLEHLRLTAALSHAHADWARNLLARYEAGEIPNASTDQANRLAAVGHPASGAAENQSESEDEDERADQQRL
jgi:DNA-binding PadR family transcriptional regulator